MVGISDIGYYICSNKIQNTRRKFNNTFVDEKFILEKIGIEYVTRKKAEETASDLCVKAYENLLTHYSMFNIDEIGLIVVCTQNGDYQIPHSSSIVHYKLNASKNCAVFDINLGCSGYVYSLDIVRSFMIQNKIRQALLFTADTYSDILDPNDKNTNLIFGDAATVTLLSTDYIYSLEKAYYKSYSELYSTLIKENQSPLYMNGKLIFNFTLLNVPDDIDECLKLNEIEDNNVDLYIMHQANKYMVNSIADRMKINKDKVPYIISQYGNTVSSSIPLVIASYMSDASKKNIILCGFGVGLSTASMLIRR